MNGDPHSPIRHFARPREVEVDPRRVFGAPVCGPARTDSPTLGERAYSLDPRLGEQWVPAVQFAWARVRMGAVLVWYAEIGIELGTYNGQFAVTMRQWVAWDAVRLPAVS